MSHTDAHRKARRRYYALTVASSGLRHSAERISVPDDIIIHSDNVACWRCGSREPCRHRP